MTFALTKVQCYGIEAEEPLNKRYRQQMYLTITAANTDVDLDIGEFTAGSLGTFWTAVSGTATGAGALQAIQDIGTRAESFDSWGGEWNTRSQYDTSFPSIVMLNTSASTGGSASVSFVLTGAATGDTVLAATPVVAATGVVALTKAASSIATADIYPAVFTGDPGATAVLRVALLRTGTTPDAGTFQVSYTNHTPNLLFASTDAPTSYQVTLKWVLMPNVGPVEYYATA